MSKIDFLGSSWFLLPFQKKPLVNAMIYSLESLAPGNESDALVL